jgi:YegS/Rv2252/BmrU family lipid kinase
VQAINEKNIAIVCNALAGVGRSVTLAEKIASELLNRKISHSLFKENWPSDFNGFTDVWISGGDGTLKYLINHYPEIQLPLVIFEGGTGNDFHWLLYGKMSFDEQLQLVLTTEAKHIDLGRCNEKYFLNDVGIGFEAAVAKGLTGKKKRAGKASFMIMILKKIFSYRSRSYRIRADGVSVESKKYLIVDINNGSRAGGGFHIAPEARADDGLLDLILINALHPLQRLRWLPVIEKGNHLDKSFIKYVKTKKVIIESDELIQSHLDGEYYTAEKMEIEILPGKLLFRY